MQTLLWSTALICSFICEMINVYFYISHEDLLRTRISIPDLHKALASNIYIEIILLGVISIVGMMFGSWSVLAFMIPFFVYQYYQYFWKKLYDYSMILNLDDPIFSKNCKKFEYKLILYLLLILIICYNFMLAFSGLVTYRLGI